jgi:hypothetical protein
MASTEIHDRVRVLLAGLEYGLHAVHNGQAWADYLRAVSRFHRCSTVAGNVWLILARRRDASRVARFHAWRAVGRHVRRGEHGIRILAPVTMRPREDGATDDPKAAVCCPRTPARRWPPTANKAAGSSRTSSTWRAASESWSGRTFPDWARRTAPTSPGNTPSSWDRGCPTTSAPRRCATNLGTRSWGTGRAAAGRHRREAAAEGTAFVVAAWAGLDTSAYSVGYVTDWAAGRDGAALVRAVAASIQRAAGRIIAGIDPDATHTESA